MNLKEYFENTNGLGVLSTADAKGHVDSAIYATPHVISEDSVAFIMRPRQSFCNVQQNPKAAYLFIEKGPGYQGRRLYLEKTGQEDDPATVRQFRRSAHGNTGDEEQATLVYFKVTHIRPLVGDKEER
jgi:hypothetical protein